LVGSSDEVGSVHNRLQVWMLVTFLVH
jgi:hypothetical protein